MQYLIPTKIHLLNPDTTDKIFNTYDPDLMERTVFDGKIVRWEAQSGRTFTQKSNQPLCSICFAASINNCILMLYGRPHHPCHDAHVDSDS